MSLQSRINDPQAWALLCTPFTASSRSSWQCQGISVQTLRSCSILRFSPAVETMHGLHGVLSAIHQISGTDGEPLPGNLAACFCLLGANKAVSQIGPGIDCCCGTSQCTKSVCLRVHCVVTTNLRTAPPGRRPHAFLYCIAKCNR